MYGSQALQPISALVLLRLTEKLNLKTSSTDVGLAYLQSDDLLQFKNNIKVPSVEFDIEEDMTPQYTNSHQGLSTLKEAWKFPESTYTLKPSLFIQKIKDIEW